MLGNRVYVIPKCIFMDVGNITQCIFMDAVNSVQLNPSNLERSSGNGATFTVNVIKVRHALEWLCKCNPYYRDVEWREDWAQEWLEEDVDVGSTRISMQVQSAFPVEFLFCT